MSLFDLIDDAKDIVCLSGAEGIEWEEIITQLSLSKNSSIAAIVLQKLRDCEYNFEVKTSPSRTSSALSESSTAAAGQTSGSPSTNQVETIHITAPIEDRSRALGKSCLSFVYIPS